MAGHSSKPNRHIRLKGTKYQFKVGIPANCRHHFNGQQNYVETTGTGDLLTARKWRDRREREMQVLFRDIQAGRLVSDTLSDALKFAESSRTAHTEEDDVDQRNLIVEIAQARSESLKPSDQAAFVRVWMGKEEFALHVEAWLSEANLAPKTTRDYRSILNRLGEWCKAKGYSIDGITTRTAGQYVSAELLDTKKMTRATAKKHLVAITGYWDHLCRRGHAKRTDEHPWSNQIAPERAKQGKKEVVERAFTDEELTKVLYLDTPTKSRQRAPKWNTELQQLALIATLSGMRLAEITNLTVEACQNGRFDLKKSKTEAGVREIPMHPALVPLVTKLTEGRSNSDLLFKSLEDLPDPSTPCPKRSPVAGTAWASGRRWTGFDAA